MCYKNLFTPCTFDLQLTIFLAVIGNLCCWHLSVTALSATYSMCYIDYVVLEHENTEAVMCCHKKVQQAAVEESISSFLKHAPENPGCSRHKVSCKICVA